MLDKIKKQIASQQKWQSNFRNIAPGQDLPTKLTIFPTVNVSPKNLRGNFTTEYMGRNQTVKRFNRDEADQYGQNEHGVRKYFEKDYMNEHVTTKPMLVNRTFKAAGKKAKGAANK